MGRTKGSKNKKTKLPEPEINTITTVGELNKGDQILATVGGDNRETKQEVITFDHPDGMYSYSTLPDGSVIHLSRYAPVKKVDKYWRLLDKDGNIIG